MPSFNLLLPDHYVFWFVLGCLSAWRISSILVEEEIFRGFREKIIGTKLLVIRNKDTGEVVSEYKDIPDTFFGQLFSCVWCMSVWVGLLCVPVFLWFPWLFLPFSFSAAAIIVDRAANHG